MSNQQQWQTYRFEQIAANINERVDDPSKAGVDRYVGLEHLDPDSLKIRRWGSPSDVEATKLRFYPGDIVFARRRAYQRKLGVAEFEGICSAHAMVLRAKPEVVLPEFLPFFIQSDLFMDRAIEISVGSLSPTVNWKTLAAQEFALPPLDEQRRLLDVLRVNQCVQQELFNAQNSLRQLRKAVEYHSFGTSSRGNHVLFKTLIQDGTLSFQTGPFGTVLKAESYTTGGHPIINPSDMSDGKILLDKCKYVSTADWQRLHKYQVKTNDMFIGRKGDMKNFVFVQPEHDGFVLGSDCIRFRVHHNTLVPKYLFFFLRADITREWLQRQAYGTIMPGINEKLLAKLVLSLPEQISQEQIVEEFDAIDDAESKLTQRLSSIAKQKQALLSLI